jgi:adsorption protein B
MLFNGAMILWRLYIRMNAFRTIYGRWEFIPVIARWLVAVAVNFFATVRSWNIFLFQSGFATRPIVWAKTEHRLPENFADSSPVVTTGS